MSRHNNLVRITLNLNKMCLWNIVAPGSNKIKIWKNLLVQYSNPAPPQGHVMSVKCEKPFKLYELTVQVWLLYHHRNYNYCTLYVSGTDRCTTWRTFWNSKMLRKQDCKFKLAQSDSTYSVCRQSPSIFSVSAGHSVSGTRISSVLTAQTQNSSWTPEIFTKHSTFCHVIKVVTSSREKYECFSNHHIWH